VRNGPDRGRDLNQDMAWSGCIDPMSTRLKSPAGGRRADGLACVCGCGWGTDGQAQSAACHTRRSLSIPGERAKWWDPTRAWAAVWCLICGLEFRLVSGPGCLVVGCYISCLGHYIWPWTPEWSTAQSAGASSCSHQ
jgi:hypothetical protein